MAHAPRADFEHTRREDSPVLNDDSPLKSPSQDHTSARLRAHLTSFKYIESTEKLKSSLKPQMPAAGSPMQGTKKGQALLAINAESNWSLRRSSRKRAADEDGDYAIESSSSTAPAKKKRTTTKQRAAADPRNPVNNLVDSIRPGLTLIIIGLNPGLTTALTGHAYAHPSNLFWKLLHWSGVTSQRHHPRETRDLPDLYSIGNTNICARPTRSGDGLSKEELIEGAGMLEEKMKLHKPQAVCIVGKGIWEVIYKTKTGKPLKAADFKYGWQDEKLWLGRTINKDGKLEWAGSKTFVATTTSGLAASMTPQQKIDVWKPLGEWMQQKRGETVKKEGIELKEED